MDNKGLQCGGYPRTDLACERTEGAIQETERTYSLGITSTVKITHSYIPSNSEDTANDLSTDGKNYITASYGRITELSSHELSELSDIIARELRGLAEKMTGRHIGGEMRLLVAGLGNAAMTADATGPRPASRITATRHLRSLDEKLYRELGCCEISVISPGVLGNTGVESADIIKGVVERTHPHLIIAIDALAARSCDRLASTVQLSDSGISPGSGIGNTRRAIDRDSMGCPVLSIGVPTVVDSSTLVYDALERAGIHRGGISEELSLVLENGRSFVVSPKDSDRICELTVELLARSIEQAFGIG